MEKYEKKRIFYEQGQIWNESKSESKFQNNIL